MEYNPNMFVWPKQYWFAEFLVFHIEFITNIVKIGKFFI